MKKSILFLSLLLSTAALFAQKDSSAVQPKQFTLTLNDQQAQVLMFVLQNGKLDGMTNADGTMRALLVQDILNQITAQNQPGGAVVTPPKKEKPKNK